MNETMAISDEQLLELRDAIRGHVLQRLRELDRELPELVEEARALDPRQVPALLRLQLATLRQMGDIAALNRPRLPEVTGERAAEQLEVEARETAERLERERVERARMVADTRTRLIMRLGG